MIKQKYINNSTIPFDSRNANFGVCATGEIWDLPLLQLFYNKTISQNKESYSIIDIGANTGAYCFIPYVDKRFKTYAIEPISECFELLKSNKNILNLSDEQIQLFQMGIMDESKYMEITIPNDIMWNVVSTFGSNPHRAYSYGAGVKKQKIYCYTLDEFVRLNNITQIDSIKIDVEGAEFYVLKGGQATLKKYKPMMLIEYEEQNTQQFGYNREKIVDLLREVGYSNIEITSNDADIFANY